MANPTDIKNIALETLALESDSIKSLSKVIDDNFVKIVETLYKSEGKIILTGTGKSAIICMKISATLNSTGTKSNFLHLSDAFHGDLGVIDRNDIIICLSKSGESEEIKKLSDYLKLNKNTLIGISCNDNSLLKDISDMFILTEIEKEACHNNLAPTTSSSCHLAIGDAIAMSLQYIKGFTPDDFSNFHPSGNLGKKLNLTVGDLIDKKRVPTVRIESNIEEVITEISTKMYGVTAVISNDKIIGVITDGDIRRVLEKKVDIYNLKASDIMSNKPKFIGINSLAIHSLRLMKKNKISQLLVLDEAEKYVGIVHFLDLIKEGIDNE
ncbi:MAG: KpsF/GutQ family sugar-phosphate isomerase [Flavobacteriales bacterium]|nr:MAG: KpsF/GutQ family sugar-phosphate isomerase [Flavobacteriales bacterium]